MEEGMVKEVINNSCKISEIPNPITLFKKLIKICTDKIMDKVDIINISKISSQSFISHIKVMVFQQMIDLLLFLKADVVVL
jgi:hypothetical protein